MLYKRALYLTNEQLPVFLPLGFVGLYRWFWFFLKLVAYMLYKPLKPRNHPRYKSSRDVTILVPTIDNGEEIKIALDSWLKNDPHEIIFITIPSAKEALEALARAADPEGKKVRVITIKKGNKRNQMTAGVNNAKTPLIIFADDDVLWPPTMIEHIIAPFEDKKIGGVGTSQTVLPVGKYFTIWEILASYRISMRNIEIVASTYIDGGVCCLSGRTAAYRTAILRDPEFQWQFTHEYWRGKYHQHSGDDKFLTRWMHNHEWKTWIQSGPDVNLSSTFKDNWRFLKQLLRWTRNTWRSDFRSLFTERTIWRRYPFVAFTMLDKMFNPITLLAGPITVIYLTTRTQILPPWVIIISYIVWLLLSRLIKYLPHFINRPQDVITLPIWIVFNIYFALMKVYCLFTLHVTEWGTRAGADGNNNQSEVSIQNSNNKQDMDIYVVKEEVIDRSRGGGKRGDIKARKEHDEQKKRKEKDAENKQHNAYQNMRGVDLEKGVLGPISSCTPKNGRGETREKPVMLALGRENKTRPAMGNRPPAMLLAPLSPKMIGIANEGKNSLDIKSSTSGGKKSMDVKSSSSGGRKSNDVKSSASGGRKPNDLKSSSSGRNTAVESAPPLPPPKKAVESLTPARNPTQPNGSSPRMQLPSFKNVAREAKELPALPNDVASSRE